MTEVHTRPLAVVTSLNGDIGLPPAIQLLRQQGSALDAVEAAIRVVESHPDDHSVGLGGLPNVLGEVELDASIMDGRTLRAGAVGSLQGYEHPISIARKVMEELPHVLVVGSGAERFAAEMGFPKIPLLTPEARAIWRQRLLTILSEEELGRLHERTQLRDLVRLVTDPEKANETVTTMALDQQGNLACGVSTSGWAWKYPGRLGDSPVIGAGGYADNRYGAAACTGRGEMAICLSTARSVVLYMKMGMTVEEACIEAMQDLRALRDPYAGAISVRALDRTGRPAGAANQPDQGLWYWQAGMDAPARMPLVHVDISG